MGQRSVDQKLTRHGYAVPCFWPRNACQIKADDGFCARRSRRQQQSAHPLAGSAFIRAPPPQTPCRVVGGRGSGRSSHSWTPSGPMQPPAGRATRADHAATSLFCGSPPHAWDAGRVLACADHRRSQVGSALASVPPLQPLASRRSRWRVSAYRSAAVISGIGGWRWPTRIFGRIQNRPLAEPSSNAGV